MNSFRSGGRATAEAPTDCAALTSGKRCSVNIRSPRNESCAAVVARNRFSVEPSSASNGIWMAPPTRKPTANPETTRGKNAFIWRTSSSRPACPPRKTKPIWMARGNVITSAQDTQAPPATRIAHEAAKSAARAPRVTVATRISRVLRVARAISAAAALPRTAVAM